MKQIFITVIGSLMFLACGNKNPTADFHITIPFPASFQAHVMNFGEEEVQTSVLYDIRSDVKQILLISQYNYRSSKMFSEKTIHEVAYTNTMSIRALREVPNDEEFRDFLGEEHLKFVQILPELSVPGDLPVLKMYLNVNDQYGQRFESSFNLDGGQERFPSMIHALHHKKRNMIIYLQYFRIREGKGESLDNYSEMTTAIENTRFF
ncbi:MAG TPA: hypothetical protein PLU49_06050 [Saprospiraceae bacterium]|nr:hypothetical protein [Saprospiraceae bacterium]